jgi:hypothetical protein
MLNQYFRNYVSVDQRDWGEHPSLDEFCYNSTMHLVIKMLPFELTLGKEVRKLMDLTIPMRQKDHSKKILEMVKGCEELYT